VTIPKFRLGFGLLLAGLVYLSCAGVAEEPDRRPLAVTKPDLETPVQEGFPLEQAAQDSTSRALFEQINRDRRRAGVAPVLWDERAAALARRYAELQLADGTYGHFLTDGRPPYARASEEGILGASAENTAAMFTTAGSFPDGEEALALESHRRMMAERPPDDGHRKTILDPNATHVGVGMALSGGNFRLDEEFVTRRYEWLRITRTGAGVTAIKVKGKARPDMPIHFVTVAREPLPGKLSRDEVVRRRTYSYPSPVMGLVPTGDPASFLGLATSRSITLQFWGRFSFAYQLDRPGLWTFVLYFSHEGEKQSVPGGAFTLRVDRLGKPGLEIASASQAAGESGEAVPTLFDAFEARGEGEPQAAVVPESLAGHRRDSGLLQKHSREFH
jgi:uncharacterized protein YkwD